MKRKGARILVVDDEREIVRLFQRTLIAHDFQVFTTTRAVDPLETLVQYRLDLLLLGLDGPGTSGLEVCQQVRAQSSVPIIVLSGNEAVLEPPVVALFLLQYPAANQCRLECARVQWANVHCQSIHSLTMEH
jgi:CheY-like chemotaxis protein